MTAPISVVIPTLNAAAELPFAAEALLPGLTRGLIARLIVTDGGSEDGTIEIARGLGADIVEGPAGRGGQIRRGVARVRSPWILILHADTRLGPDWADVAEAHIAGGEDVAGWFCLRFRAAGFWPRVVAAGANFRAQHLGLPYGDQGLLVSRSLLDAVGGVPDLPLMEDVVLAGRLKGRLRRLDAEAATSAARYLAEGWARRVTRNLWTLARFKAGVAPERLVRDYASSSRN